MRLKDITLLTVSFNNNIMTTAMLKSFLKQVGDLPEILVIDNGTHTLLSPEFKKTFNVFDNSRQHVTSDYHQCSKNHCSTIDYALKNLIKTKWVLLVDNDILFKPEVKTLLDNLNENDFDCVGEIGWDDAPPNRLFPYFCIINVEKFKNDRISYFDNERCIGPGSIEIGPRGPFTKCWYKDTGCSFYEDIRMLWRIEKIKLDKFIVHNKTTGQPKMTIAKFIEQNRKLFED